MTVRLVRSAPALMDNRRNDRFTFDIFDGDLRVGVQTFRPLTGSTAKIGFDVLPDCRDRGYATESLRLTIEWAWAQGFETLVTGVAESNKASQTVLFRNGFRVDFTTDEAGGRMHQVRLERSWSADLSKHWWTEKP